MRLVEVQFDRKAHVGPIEVQLIPSLDKAGDRPRQAGGNHEL